MTKPHTRSFRILADKRDGSAPARLLAQGFEMVELLDMAAREMPHWDRHGWRYFRIEARTADGWRETHHIARGGWFAAFVRRFRSAS